MKNIKYLFISRVSSHYRYYQKLVAYLGKDSELKKIKHWAFPRLKYVHLARKLDLDDLTLVHVERKKVRHPLLAANELIVKFITAFYKIVELYRASYYFSFFQKHNVENLILWNGQKQPNKTPYEVAKALGIKTHLFENGLLPNTTVLDVKGVNALNSMPRNPEFYLNWQASEVEIDTQLEVRENHKHKPIPSSLKALPEKYIFVPFQVPNDTQIICQSPWIKTMDAFYEQLECSIPSLPVGHVFVVKEHPSWPRTFSHLHKRNPKIVFANESNTQTLIENATAVITINSTVGIESLLLNKKVITLGNSFLNIPGLVQHCQSQTDLASAIENIETWQIHATLRQRFLAFLKQEYLIDQRWDKLKEPERHFAQIKARLETPFVAKENI